MPVVGVTFGLPPEPVVRALQRAGSRVLATVTSVAEAEAAVALGVDALVAQGTEAGAHSGVHDPASGHPPLGTAELLPRVVAVSGLPVLAAGGIGRPEQVRDLVAAGAAAVMVGTALLRTDESGASRVHQDALADPRYTGTVVTRAFTGRPARGLRNGFIERHQDSAPLGYPAVHHLTRGCAQRRPPPGTRIGCICGRAPVTGRPAPAPRRPWWTGWPVWSDPAARKPRSRGRTKAGPPRTGAEGPGRPLVRGNGTARRSFWHEHGKMGSARTGAGRRAGDGPPPGLRRNDPADPPGPRRRGCTCCGRDRRWW
ncbi:NAD(P)H-dependent flavin oxidoreductase [Streptacidiphilus monticola]